MWLSSRARTVRRTECGVPSSGVAAFESDPALPFANSYPARPHSLFIKHENREARERSRLRLPVRAAVLADTGYDPDRLERGFHFQDVADRMNSQLKCRRGGRRCCGNGLPGSLRGKRLTGLGFGRRLGGELRRGISLPNESARAPNGTECAWKTARARIE